MANPVVSPLDSWTDDSTGADQNTPQGASSLQPGGQTELAGELRVIKSNVRGMSLDLGFEIWAGTSGYGTTPPVYVSPTSFNLTGDQRRSNGGPVEGARQIRATLSTGFVYAYIINDVFSGGVTTVTLGDAVLDATLTQVDFGSHNLKHGGLPGAPFTDVVRTTNQSIANATTTPLSFSAILNTNAGPDMWTIGAPDRLVILTPGLYLVTGQATFDVNGTGERAIGFAKNGDLTTLYATHKVAAVPGTVTQLASAGVIFCSNSGDYLQFGVEQSSGGNLNVLAGTAVTPQFNAMFLFGSR